MNGVRELAEATGATLRRTLDAAKVRTTPVNTNDALEALWRDHGYSRHLLDFQWSRACSNELGHPTALRPPWSVLDFDSWRDAALPGGGRHAIVAIEPIRAQATLLQLDDDVPSGALADLPQRLVIFTREWLLADGEDDFVIARGTSAVEWMRRQPDAHEIRASAPLAPRAVDCALAAGLNEQLNRAAHAVESRGNESLAEDLLAAANATLLTGDFLDVERVVGIISTASGPSFPQAIRRWMRLSGPDAPLAAVLRRRLPPAT